MNNTNIHFSIKKIFFIFSAFILNLSTLFAESKCYVILENKTEFSTSLMSAMSTSIISQFVTKVDEVPLSGIDAKENNCIYKVVFEKSDDTTFLVISGPKLNSYGDSKLIGADGAQQALLKALYRSIPEQQNKICDLYENVIQKCKNINLNEDLIKTNEPNYDDEDKDLNLDDNKNNKIKIIGGYFGNSTHIYGNDNSGKYLYNNGFTETISSSGFLGAIFRYYYLEKVSLDLIFSSNPVYSVSYESIKDPSPNSNYSEQENVSGDITSLYILGNYNWFGRDITWMNENTSFFVGGGYGTISTNIKYQNNVILNNENKKFSDIQSNGFSISLGFDYVFSNNFLAGLYYSSTNGSLSGSRIDDLNSTGYDVHGDSSSINFSFGYEFQ